MTILQNAFANTSSSLLIGKVHGNILDVLMPPLSAGELTLALTLGGVTRGIICAMAVVVPADFVVDITISNLARKSVVSGKSVSARGYRGGRGNINKNKLN